MKQIRIALVTLLSLALLLLSGCDNQATKTETSSSNTVKATTTETNGTKQDTTKAPLEKMVIYIPAESGKGVEASSSEVEKEKHTPKEAVQTLLNEDATQKYPTFPKGTKVLDVKVVDGVAQVNLSKEFQKATEQGTLTNELELASLVNTLTEFKSISGVTILVEGKKLATLGSFDLSDPLKRMEKKIVK